MRTTLDRRWAYRVGGLSAIAIGIGYIVIIPVYVAVGAPPSGGEPWLAYVAGKSTGWWAILGLSVLTDVLFIPVSLALYLAWIASVAGQLVVAGSGAIIAILASVLMTAWVLVVGYRLYQLGHR